MQKLNRVKNMDPNNKYCSCAECYVIYQVHTNCANDFNNENSLISIENNNDRLCDKCLDYKTIGLNEKSKRCPGCMMYVTKIDGCNHIYHTILDPNNPKNMYCQCSWCFHCGLILKHSPFKSNIIAFKDIDKFCNYDCPLY